MVLAARRCRPNEIPAGAVRGHFYGPPQVSAAPTRCRLLVDCYVMFFGLFHGPEVLGGSLRPPGATAPRQKI